MAGNYPACPHGRIAAYCTSCNAKGDPLEPMFLDTPLTQRRGVIDEFTTFEMKLLDIVTNAHALQGLSRLEKVAVAEVMRDAATQLLDKFEKHANGGLDAPE